MEHKKLYLSKSLQWKNKEIVVEGPVLTEMLHELRMHEDLKTFRQPKDQQRALEEIASLPEGRIILARDSEMVIGYVTFHYPDEREPWSQGNMVDLIEFGAIEVVKTNRFLGLGKEMLRLSFANDQMENAIVFATEYYRYWDLHNNKLSVWEYRKMTENLLGCVDMIRYDTDDSEICSHPANCLMVRIGKQVPSTSIEQFDRLRFRKLLFE
ncbi:N-acetyltransferase [Paenibacillus sp.]|jgi:acetoin utilization protein AcuA|uniref:N-acetyltransferase n=1 Tax=Paenibacillus sp. TaxID=58172 RepID=UPI0028393166|nr:N-acetyltransferase [Paenibacillus sp.]MDR0271107.1 N-acetyltransferase [Paenibacillus sp.]